MTRTGIRLSVIGLAVVALCLATVPVIEAMEKGSSEEVQASEEKVQQELDEKLAQRRQAMIAEARAALEETNSALEALDEGKPDEALDALATVTGKLELIVARDPELALAPVDVDFVTHDIYGTPEAIRRARERAEDLLEDGKVQNARVLLSGLASEIVIRVHNLPLATYPDAIKEVSPLIDEGKIEEAQAALVAALNTLVVTDHVISLPVMRARYLLDEAEELVNAEEPAEGDREKIADLVKGAREQLEMAELLGYGEEQEHEKFRAQIAELQKKIGAEEETRGVFARLQKSLDGFQTSFFE